jgi:hypothetical protein
MCNIPLYTVSSQKLIESQREKYKENYIKTHHNQIAQNYG